MTAALESPATYVTFHVDGARFALPVGHVREIVRPPHTVHVPLTPPTLGGLANLRGQVLPILDTRQLMGCPSATHTRSTRVVVAWSGTQVGLLVDQVDRVCAIRPDQVEAATDVQGVFQRDHLSGVVRDHDGSLLQLLDLERTIDLQFTALVSTLTGAIAPDLAQPEPAAAPEPPLQVVCFALHGELYAFPIEHVAEIVRLPEIIRSVPGAHPHICGIIDHRDRLLPLIDLRGHFGLPAAPRHHRQRIVVVRPEGCHTVVGVVVDAVERVTHIPPGSLAPLPGRSDRPEVEAIARLDRGRQLLSILSPAALFASLDLRPVAAPDASGAPMSTDFVTRVVVFRLGDEEYGADVSTVSEIIRVPDVLTAVPRADEAIDGLTNLRGQVLAVADLRTRLGMHRVPRTKRHRILVLDFDGLKVGFVVDAVVEVLQLPSSRIAEPPRLSDVQERLIPRVANFPEARRMVLLLDVFELLDETLVEALP